jgi:regulatory protein
MLVTGTKTKGRKLFFEIDGQACEAVESVVWDELGFDMGDELTPEQLESLYEADKLYRARRSALFMLSRRSYSKHEMTRRLAAKTDEPAAQKAVSRMEELGLIDDAEYAQTLARYCYEQKGYALRRIRHFLWQKGFDRQTAQEATEFIDPDRESERALVLLCRRNLDLSDEAQRRRAYSWLLRQGYSPADAFSALGRAGGEIEEEP